MKSKLLILWASEPLNRKVAYLIGAFVMLTGLLHLVAFPFIENAAWSGYAGFRKPIIFGLSAGFTVITMAWLLRYFKPRPKIHGVMMSAMSAALLIEIIIIDLQRFRGLPSHFNMGTPLDAILWSIMGLSILIFATVSTTQAILSFGKLTASPPMAMAIRTSMILFFLSQVSGQLIVLHGTGVVMDGDTFQIENIAHSTTYGKAGNLKLPHAITLHAIQALPLLGLIIAPLKLRRKPAQAWIVLSATGFFGVSLIAQIQAYLGKSFLHLDPFGASLLVLSLLAFEIPFLYGTVALITQRNRRPQLPAKRKISQVAPQAV